jgi:hypothetical protein
VIIDKRVDRNSDAGGYVQVYRQQPAVTPFSSLSLDLKVVGRRIPPLVYSSSPPGSALPTNSSNSNSSSVPPPYSSQRLGFGSRHNKVPQSPWSRVLVMAAASAAAAAAQHQHNLQVQSQHRQQGAQGRGPSPSAHGKSAKREKKDEAEKSRVGSFGQILVGKKKPMLSFAKVSYCLKYLPPHKFV